MNQGDELLKVANIIEDGRIAGPQVRMANVASALGSRIETTLVFPNENSQALQERCENMGVKFVTLPLTRLTREPWILLRYVLFSWLEVVGLVRHFRKEKYNLVHISGGSWQYKGLIAARICGIPAIWHLNDTSMPRAIRTIFRVLSRHAQGFIFASHRSRDYYGTVVSHDTPEAVVPAPVDLGLYDPSISPNPDATDLPLFERLAGKIVVGTISNISPVKDLGTFVEMAALSSRERDDLAFVAVGPVYPNQSTYFERLQQQAATAGLRNIHFVGGRKEVRPFLSRFDIYACTSRAESSPLSVWEAMAMCKPVVSTDVGDIPRHVRDGVNGTICPVGDSGSLADSVLMLAENEEIRRRLGDAARSTAHVSFSLAKVTEQTCQFYCRVCDTCANSSGSFQ